MINDQIVPNPTYMLIGEAPGEQEVRENHPFVGSAGRQLDRILQTVGIKREECYITNVVQERPPKNNFGVYYQDSQRKVPSPYLVEATKILKDKIAQVHPKMVICLGNEALKAVTGFTGIEARRGSIYSIGDSKVIATLHPSAILRGSSTGHWYLPVAIMDFQLAKVEVDNPTPPDNPKVELVTTPEKLASLIHIMGSDKMVVAFDIETSMVGGEQVLCFGFAFNTICAYVVPLNNQTSAMEVLALQELLKMALESKNIYWLGQNGYAFDIPTLRRLWGVKVPNYCFDTMVAHHVLHPEFPHDLAFLTSTYTRIPYYKDMASSDLYRYNGLDAYATFVIAFKMMDELKQRGLYDLYKSYYTPLLATFRKMQERGLKVDVTYQKELKTTLTKEIGKTQGSLDKLVRSYTNLDSLQLRLRRLQALAKANKKTIRLTNKKTGKRTRRRVLSLVAKCRLEIRKKSSINVRSNKDLPQLLYKTLGLPTQTKDGKVTTNEGALNRLYIKTQNSILKDIIHLRKTENKLSRWGKLATDEAQRVYTQYKFVETGRLSSGKYEAK